MVGEVELHVSTPALEPESALTTALSRSYADPAPDAYFFRAELLAHFGALLDERERDPDFMGNPYWVYGGRPLQTRSHGEAFLAVIENRLGGGLYFVDEPESALSPQRQLHLLAHMADLVRQGDTLLSFDDDEAKVLELEDTAHFQLTRDTLARPQLYWRRLAPDWYD